MSLVCAHDEAQHRFVAHPAADADHTAAPDSDALAMVRYHRRGNVLDCYHVFVPPAFRGQGVAEKLSAYVFDYARAQGLKIIPTCPYLRSAFLRRHPQYHDLVAPG